MPYQGTKDLLQYSEMFIFPFTDGVITQPSAYLPRHQQANQAQPSASAFMQPLSSVAARHPGSGVSGPGPSTGATRKMYAI